MSSATVAYQRRAPRPAETGINEKDPRNRVPESPSIPAFPLFTQANPLGIQFSIPFSASWGEEETPTYPTHPERQAFEIENAPEWAKEGGVVREEGKGRVLYPEGQPFGDDHPFRYDRNRRQSGDSDQGSDFSDKGQYNFTAQHEGFDDPMNKHEDITTNDSNYLENEDDIEDNADDDEENGDDDEENGEGDFSNEGDNVGSDILSALGNDNAGDDNYSLKDDPDFKERQALYDQATEDNQAYGMARFNETNDGHDFFSQSLHGNQGQGDFFSSGQEQWQEEWQEPWQDTVDHPIPPKTSARVKIAQNPFKLYAGEGSAPKFVFNDLELEDDVKQEGEGQNEVATTQESEARPRKQLKEKFMKDREELEAQLNARGESMYRPANERPNAGDHGPSGRRVMGQAELRAQMAMQRIAAAAMRATALRSRRGKKGKRRGGGMPVVFI